MDRVNATPADWHHWSSFGLRTELMPIVTDPTAQPAPRSAVKQFGKIPSLYDAKGRTYGIANWTGRDFSLASSVKWRHDPRYGIGLRTGPLSGVYAIDCDLTDAAAATEAQRIIAEAFAPTILPIRTRANAPKFLVPLRIEHKPPLAKRIITHHDDRIEFLAHGQQFVCCGYHPSGVLYEWRGGAPKEIPEVTLEEFERLWAALSVEFETGTTRVTATMSAHAGVVPNMRDGILHEITPEQLADLKDALQYPPLVAAAADNSVWSEIGYSLLSLGRPVGYNLWIEFSKRAPKYAPGAPEAWWEAHE